MVSVVTDLADEIKELPVDADLGVVRHPSGWWKANERWNPPADADTSDRMVALSLAVAAIVLGSFLPWGHQLFTTVHGTDGNGAGNITLLLGGTAGALVARWWLEGSADRRMIAAICGLCATAASSRSPRSRCWRGVRRNRRAVSSSPPPARSPRPPWPPWS